MTTRWLRFSTRMLLVAIAICAVAIRFRPVPDKNAPNPKWRKAFYKDASPLSNVPQISLLASNGSSVQVTAKNVGDTTLEYFSAGPENISLFQEIDIDGEWKIGNWSWCGTGKKTFEIAPNKSIELAVSFWDDAKRERMLANFSEKNTNRAGLVVLSTEPENSENAR